MKQQSLPNYLLQEIQNQLIDILPRASSICVRNIDPEKKEHLKLYQDEIFTTQKMSIKRLADFSAGRICAKSALAKLGILDFPLLINENRAPMWPEKVVGSISHSKNVCIVAAVFNNDLEALGIDIETVKPINIDVLPLICDSTELIHLEELEKDSYGTSLKNAKLIFSIKESIFKCLNPRLGCWIDFKEMQVKLDPVNKIYSATSNSINPLLSDLEPINGHWFSNDYFHVSSCWI